MIVQPETVIAWRRSALGRTTDFFVVPTVRDQIYGQRFRSRVENMGIEHVVIAPRSPWQNPFVERLVGSIRRECLDHVIVLNERHLRRILTAYFDYHNYHRWRAHQGLDMDCPDG